MIVPYVDRDLYAMARSASGLRARGQVASAERLEASVLRLLRLRADAYFAALSEGADPVAAAESVRAADLTDG